MELKRSLKDILSGLIFIGFGAAFSLTALTYPMGSGVKMGSGSFPFALGLILSALGLAIAVKGFAARAAPESLGPVPWRGAALIIGALLFFGLTVRGLGLVPALFVTVFVTGMASRTLSMVAALVLAAAMTGICYLIFIKGLGNTVPVFGPWLPV